MSSDSPPAYQPSPPPGIDRSPRKTSLQVANRLPPIEGAFTIAVAPSTIKRNAEAADGELTSVLAVDNKRHSYMMENSESNNTIATDLLLTPSVSSQHGGVAGAAGAACPTHIPPPGSSTHSSPLKSGADARSSLSEVGSPRKPIPPAPPRRRSTLKNLHRIVEQDDREPICVILFKWGLIIAGALMLGVVLFFMGEVIWAWTTGTMDELYGRNTATASDAENPGGSNDTLATN